MSPIYRDSQGHFCSREEAIRQGTIREDGSPIEAEEAPQGGATPAENASPREGEWGGTRTQQPVATIPIDTGRGQVVEVPVGAPFSETIERVADEAHYGGYFRVFLNGSELVDPEEAPEKIEASQRIAITSYDKVG
jgi:hypothetical protein